jgi:phage shock protein C
MIVYYQDPTVQVTSSAIDVDGRRYPLAQVRRVWFERDQRSWRELIGRGGWSFTYVLPLIGGGLVALVGFGFISGEKKKKKMQRSKTSSHYSAGADPLDAFLYPEGKKGVSAGKSESKGKSGSTSSKKFSGDFDSYAMSKQKKLFKSRTDKKISGVCGGLARYFGISSTMVRLIFAIATIFGYGSMILIYIALAIALPKEPIDLLDDF